MINQSYGSFWNHLRLGYLGIGYLLRMKANAAMGVMRVGQEADSYLNPRGFARQTHTSAQGVTLFEVTKPCTECSQVSLPNYHPT